MIGGIEVRLLGPVHALHGGHTIGGTPQQRAVLAVLALQCSRLVTTDALIDELWPVSPPKGARATVHTYVSRLRTALEDGATDPVVLRSEAAGYVLDVDRAAVDAHVFESRASAARAVADPAERAATLSGALALWEGPALAGIPAGPAIGAATVRLEELRLQALEDRVDAELALGRLEGLVGEVDSLVREHPYRERLHLQRMLVLYRCGRPADAVRAYHDARDLLRRELGVEPAPALQDLHTRILRHDPTLDGPGDGPDSSTPHAPRQAPAGNIPQRLTSFVGRSRETEELLSLLESARLVTVVGPAGSGKTRLAVEVADRLQSSFRDGGWLVELGALHDGRFVANTVAQVLSPAERPRESVTDSLVARLQDRETLIVLDNCEHVADPAAQLAAELLRRCATLRILATSREPLRVDGETTFPLEPFDAPPDVHWSQVGELADADSVRLFLDRAQAASPGFELSAVNATSVVHVCRTLEGIPLAIELAAARLRSLDIERLAAVVDDRLRILVGGSRTALPHHRTLRAAIAWSHDLLEDEEAALFRRLAVFAGGFTSELAESVCGDGLDGDVLTLISGLVDKGLVLVNEGGALSYRMLETIGQYAAERLSDSGEEADLRRRHAAALLELAVDADVGLREGDQERWLGVLEAQHDNVRAAIGWCVEHGEAELGIRLAGRMWWFWHLTLRLDEGQQWLAATLAAARQEVPPTRRVRALVGSGFLAWLAGRTDQAEARAAQALALAQEAGSSHATAVTLALQALLATERGTPDDADRLMDSATLAFEEVGQPWAPMALLSYSGVVALQQGQLDRAEALFTASRRRFAAAEHGWGVNWARWGVARVATRRGDPATTIALIAENLPYFHGVEGTIGLTYDVEGLGLAALQAGAYRSAARLLAAAAAANRDTGVQLLPCDRADDARAWELLRARLGSAELERETRRGAAARRSLLDLALTETAKLAALDTGAATRQGVSGEESAEPLGAGQDHR